MHRSAFTARLLLLASVMAGCGGSGTECPPGSETCACYGNGTCDTGLRCLSGLCVVDPGPDGDTGTVDGDSQPDGDTGQTVDGDTEQTADGDQCRAGSDGCACTGTSGCDGDLICSGNVCRPFPGSATACTTDAECRAVNQFEYCFTITGEASGRCMLYCDREGARCPDGFYCDNFSVKCVPIDGFCRGNFDCPNPQREFCEKGPGNDWGICRVRCNLPGESCPELYRCIETTGACQLKEDLPACTNDRNCLADQYCDQVAGSSRGFCRTKCNTVSNPCNPPLVCRTDGHCGAPQGCACDPPCEPPYLCDQLYCQCVLNCPACGPGKYCDKDSAPFCVDGPCRNPTVCGILLEQCCYGYNCSAVVYGLVGYCQ